MSFHLISKVNLRNWVESGICFLRIDKRKKIEKFDFVFDKEKMLKNLGATFQELQEQYNKWKQTEIDIFFGKY